VWRQLGSSPFFTTIFQDFRFHIDFRDSRHTEK
jgi:hypothetical protein